MILNNIRYTVNEKIMRQESYTIRKIIYSKISDHNNISLTISNINNKIINVYISLCYDHRNIFRNLSYEEIMDLLLVLDMNTLNSFGPKDYDLFLIQMCKIYEFKYVVSVLYKN